jgi:hypothetical protein
MDGQRRRHDRDLVAGRPALVLGAHADRHAGPQLQAGDVGAAVDEEAAEPAGHGGQHDVVHRGAGGLLDRLVVLEPGPHDGDRPVRPGCAVQRRLGRAVEQRLRGGGQRGGGLQPLPHGAVGVQGQRQPLARHAQRLPTP